MWFFFFFPFGSDFGSLSMRIFAGQGSLDLLTGPFRASVKKSQLAQHYWPGFCPGGQTSIIALLRTNLRDYEWSQAKDRKKQTSDLIHIWWVSWPILCFPKVWRPPVGHKQTLQIKDRSEGPQSDFLTGVPETACFNYLKLFKRFN